MTLLWLFLASAGAQQLSLEVRPALAGATDIDLGMVTTRIGQPRTGRRVRTERGAHFVVPMRVSVREIGPTASLDTQLRTWSPSAPQTFLAPSAAEVDVYVRVQIASTGVGLAARLGDGRRTDWGTGPNAGRPIAGETFVTTLDRDGTRVHELSLYAPDEAWGLQRVALIYTAVPR